jgi:hypothetical protein
MLNAGNRSVGSVPDFRVINDVMVSFPLVRVAANPRDTIGLTDLPAAQMLYATLRMN